jgi:hypothetical protein
MLLFEIFARNDAGCPFHGREDLLGIASKILTKNNSVRNNMCDFYYF